MINQKRHKFEQYQDMIARIYPELRGNDSSVKTLSRTVTFQVTDACNLRCSYCYQINKGTRKMSMETAKKFIDLLLSGDKGFDKYVDPSFSPALIVEFIGGEPFLEVELIDQICTYLFREMICLNHPWVDKWSISICSNGTLYRDPKVQEFLHKWHTKMSFSVTIDGDKDLHDSCRVFPDGSGSYDLAIDAATDWMKHGYYMGSKITISPYNIDHMVHAIKHMVELGYDDINANCVYEEGWTAEHATKFYHYLCEISDWFINENLVATKYVSLFVDTFFRPKNVDDLQNWCGGTGSMLSCDPDGRLFPCIRYMESSLGTDQEPYCIGTVDDGIAQLKCHCDRLNCLNCIDRRTESTDECFYCPIAEGCSWCSAYNYQVNGTPDSRATFICIMHKARALGNAYYWSRYYEATGSIDKFKLYVPKEWALEFITESEWNDLVDHPNIEICENPYKDIELKSFNKK